MVSSYWSISSTSSSSSSSSSLLLEGGASVSYIGSWKITICTLNAAPPTITLATLLEYIYKPKTERTRVTGFCLGSSSPSSSNRSPPLVAAVGAGLSVLVGVVVSTGTGGGSGSSGSRVGGSLSVCVRLVDAGGASLSSSSPKRSSFGKKRSCGWHAHFCSRASQRFSPYLSFPFAPLSLAPARPAKACQICCLLIVPRLLEEEDCLPHREAEVRRPSCCSQGSRDVHVIWSIKIIHESCGFIMGVSRRSIAYCCPKRAFLALFFFVPKKSKTFLQQGNIICTLTTAANSFYY